MQTVPPDTALAWNPGVANSLLKPPPEVMNAPLVTEHATSLEPFCGPCVAPTVVTNGDVAGH